MIAFKNIRNVGANAELLLGFGIGCRCCNSPVRDINSLIDQKAVLAILALLLQAPLIILDKILYSLLASSTIGAIFAILFTSIFKILSIASYLVIAAPIALVVDVVITPVSNILLTVLSCLKIDLSPLTNRFQAFFDKVFDYVRPKLDYDSDDDYGSSYRTRTGKINITKNTNSKQDDSLGAQIINSRTSIYLPSSPNNINASDADDATTHANNDIKRRDNALSLSI